MRGAWPRESSPRPGSSILITSAPRSARFIAQNGPASTRLRSSTRMPASGFSSSMKFLSLSDLAPPRTRLLLLRTHRFGRRHDEARLFSRALLLLCEDRPQLRANQRLEEGDATHVGAVAQTRGRRRGPSRGLAPPASRPVAGVIIKPPASRAR